MTATDLTSLDAALETVRRELAGTTAQRERDRVLLHEPLRTLLDAGFGALRVPTRFGGLGADHEQLFTRLIDLAAVDPNLAHVFRGHIAFVESLNATGYTGEAADYAERWAARAASGSFVGNAQSERTATSALGATIDGAPGALRLNGVKYYTTGSIYADLILLTAVRDGATVTVVADATHPGVRSVDDWDGFGQPLTGSGTTTFVDVPVSAADLRPYGADAEAAAGEYLAAVFQLSLLAVVAGIGIAAHQDAVEYVRGRSRIFGFAGEAHPRDNELVQQVVGRLSAQADAARRLVLSAARDLDAAIAQATAPTRADAFRAVALDVFRLQQTVPRLVLDAATELFEVGGASAVSTSRSLDRHWRNARTIFSHNPAIQRARVIGEFELNGTFSAWGRRAADPV